MYVQKYGKRDAVHTTVKGVRNLVHAVMDGRQPHGDAYARVSQSIPGSAPVVPHIVHAARPGGGNLRRALGIPSNATVFARHGGQGQFNLWFAREAVLEAAGVRPDIFFLFLTTKNFCGRRGCPPNVIHLPSSTDRFDLIRTSDAMIHGRWEGETFGLAVAEFATHNRPVITSNRSFPHFTLGRAHLDILGARGIYYYDRATLVSILLGFNRTEAAQRNWLAYTEFEPRPVMQRFWEVFLA